MGKIKRGGYIFRTWKGDHPPRHCHVYKDARLIMKYDLEKMRPFGDREDAKIEWLIKLLVKEGKL